MSNQKKLVEALKAFMEKGVIPYLGDTHPALTQWKYLSGILSADSIDPAQLDFYLLMANKSSSSGVRSEGGSMPRPGLSYPLSGEKITSGSYVNDRSQGQQNLTFGGESRRKHLMSGMQNFQSTMIKNQQKLQGFSKKGNTGAQLNVSTNTSYTSASKKYI